MLIDEKNIDQVINTIRTVHQTAVDQRWVDLTEYLTELFQSIQSEQKNIFTMLTRLLHDYQDSAALKVEFLKAKCLETIYQLLNTDEDNIKSILEFIIELLKNSQKAQEQFFSFNGYQKYFNSLRYIKSPTMNFINQLIGLMIQKFGSQSESSIESMVNNYVIFVNPHIAVSLIDWLPYLMDTSYQQYIISSITKIVLRSSQNKMMACSNGVILALLETLNNNDEDSNKLEEKVVMDIFSLLEKLSRFSINAEEIRYICQFLHQNLSFKNQLLQLLIIAAKHDDPDVQLVSSYFDLQQPNSGIILPTIRRWPTSTGSISHHFSFHCWLKLNHEFDSYPYEGRRQIYSFYSDSMGCECFIRSSSLIISVTDQQELAYVEIIDCNDLIDGCWHSLTIVHKAQRSSLLASTFQTQQTCHLTIYTDGSLRKEIPDFKYVSFGSHPINSATIGSPHQYRRPSVLRIKNESLSTTISRSILPLKELFSSKTKSSMNRKDDHGLYSRNVIIIDPNAQDTIFGSSNCLYGQLGCIWVLAEALDALDVKHLHLMGGNLCRHYYSSLLVDNVTKSANIFDLLSTNSLLIYHPLASGDHICLDISGGSPNNGRLVNVLCLRAHSFSESIASLGGCPIFYPLIELLRDDDSEKLDDILCLDDNKVSSDSLSNIDDQIYSNPIASIIYLIRSILITTSTNILIEQMTKQHNIEILGKYLNLISPSFVDQQLLVSIQQLMESSQHIDPSHRLTIQLIRYILFDFNLWNKAIVHVRMLHLQYIAMIIQYDKSFNREIFDVQCFLDIVKQHFQDDTDEQRQLRDTIYGIIKYLIQSHVRMQDLNALLSAISTLSLINDVLTHELLDFILGLLNPSTAIAAKLIELLSKPNMVDGLYSILIVNTLSSETKEIVVKIMKHVIQSKYVSQPTKAQLRLETNNIGFGGIISGMPINELSSSIVHEILDLVISSNSLIAIHHLNIILTLLSAASIEVRCVVARALIAYFLNHPSACQLYARCHGWQETLANFFVKTRRSSIVQSLVFQSGSQSLPLIFKEDESLSSSQSSLHDKDIHESSIHLVTSLPTFDFESNPEDGLNETNVEKSDLSLQPDLTATINYNSLTSNGFDISIGCTNNSEETNTNLVSSSTNLMITQLKSSSSSKEDLALSIHEDNLNDNLIESITIDNDLPSPLQTMAAIATISNVEDSTLNARSSMISDSGSDLEEMCETMILVIVMIIWKGVVNCDESAWINRGQIFAALRRLHREYNLYFSLDYIERRILELSMEVWLNDLKLDEGTSTSTYENNCHELIKIVYDFILSSNNNSERISENLINGILPMLDAMLLFKHSNIINEPTNVSLSSKDHSSESSLIGLHILLTLLAHSNTSFYGKILNRIHSLLNSRPLNGREEAAYLLSYVNGLLLSLPNIDDSEHCTYLLSLMKMILDKSYDLLQINQFSSNISEYQSKFSTLEDLRQCILSNKREDWQQFIQMNTEPYADHYQSMSIKPFQMNMKIWWNNCHEMMNTGIRKRNRQIAVEKLKFQNFIVQPWYQRNQLNEQRTSKLNQYYCVHQLYVNKEWNNRKQYFYGERGLYFNDEQSQEKYWILSNRENAHRMRCKLIENDEFNNHDEESRLRDNLHINKITKLDQNTQNKVTKNDQKGNVIDENELLYISNYSKSYFFDEKENILIGTKCSLITSTSITDGEFIITDKHMYFFDLTTSKSCLNNFKYPVIWLREILLRRYNLRPTALEFFLINQTNFFLNFDKNLPSYDKKIRRKIIQKLMSFRLSTTKSTFPSLATTMTPQEILKESKITQKWMMREISNFEYLMMLNTIAGRTYNDLNQYPIFPWILKDYTSQVLDINNPNIFRDFSKPIGIQNPKHIQEVKLKYESFDDPSGLIKKFHYGTHYSNSASVMHYLIRMEPFTTLHIQLQSGRFDIADRQFHSFQSSWANIMDSPNDGKELIPEFFYLPEFLVNSNRFNLGTLQLNNQNIDNVQLPPWAHNSPEEFIHLHRLALESEYVSSHLHEWIDLIFGYKQRGQAAVDAFNVFMYCSYEKVFDTDTIDDSVIREAVDGMIQNFGRLPAQLLTEPHPPRQRREHLAHDSETQGYNLNLFQNINRVRAFFVEMTTTNEHVSNPIIYISIPKNQIRSFIQQGTPDTLITINKNGVIGNNGWYSFDKTLNNMFTFERDGTLEIEKNRMNKLVPFSSSINITSRLFAVSHDGKFIFSGGHWDYSLCVYSLLKSKTISSMVYHTDVITCLALDSRGYIIVTGSRDTTCVIWYLSSTDQRWAVNINDQDTTSIITPETVLYGHTDEITSICVSSDLDLVVSGSLDGTCNIYTIENGVYVRTLRPTNDKNDPVVNLRLSDERHILVQTVDEDTNLFLYSINGDLVRTRKFDYRIVDMILADQYIILAVNQYIVSANENTDPMSSCVAKIIIKDMFEMATIRTIRFRTEIHCLFLTKDLSHLIISVKDGKLFVVTPTRN